ncbi:E3 UFM1-protein ligase 1 [Quaeritorhiza haematococci]|nr:E3 UFM1-protein ligase 1 [Quaeritorhiza haematococci]
MPELEEMNFQSNSITTIPDEFANLTKIKSMRFSRNAISTFPSAVLKQTPVAFIELEGNPISEDDFRQIDGYDQLLSHLIQRCNTKMFSTETTASTQAWKEVRDLADLFKQAQLKVQTVQHLTEEHVVELVDILLKNGELDLLFTTDGRAYLTQEKLEEEIRTELRKHGGRVNLIDLQQTIGVDLTRVEKKVSQIISSEGSLWLVQGELIQRQYMDSLTEEINEWLLARGQVRIGELCQRFNLPSEFLQKATVDNAEKGAYYTDAFISRQTSMIQGIFSAITRPTPIQALLSRFDLSERFFHGILESLIKGGKLLGRLKGRRDNAVYIPNLYDKIEQEKMKLLWLQQGFIEFTKLRAVDIEDPHKFVKESYPNSLILSTCALSEIRIMEIDYAIEEEIKKGWIDIKSLLSAAILEADFPSVVGYLKTHGTQLKSENTDGKITILHDRFIVSSSFVLECEKALLQYVHARVVKERSTKKGVHQTTSEEKRKTKGKGGKSRKESIDESDLTSNECPPAVIDSIGGHLMPKLKEQYSSLLRAIFLPANQYSAATPEMNEQREQILDQIMAKFTDIFRRTFICAKSIEVLRDDGVRANLDAYLLQTLGSEMFDLLIAHQHVAISSNLFVGLVDEHTGEIRNLPFKDSEQRTEALKLLPPDTLSLFSSVKQLLDQKQAREYLTAIQHSLATLPHFKSNLLSSPDDSEAVSIVDQYVRSLKAQLNSVTEPALVLHLTCLVLFSHCHPGRMLHASGKFVPRILKHLQRQLKDMEIAQGSRGGDNGREGNVGFSNVYELLNGYQRAIVAVMKGAASASTAQVQIGRDLELIKEVGNKC